MGTTYKAILADKNCTSTDHVQFETSGPQFLGWNLKFEKYRLEENKVHVPFIYTHSYKYGQMKPPFGLFMN